MIRVDPSAPSRETLDDAVEAIRRGALISSPTDTVYALACDASNADAARRIFEAKGRPAHNPLILLGHDAAALLRSGRPTPHAVALAARFWPGALTLVVPLAAPLPVEVTAGGETIGLRVPDHPVALALLSAYGAPLATTSANRSGARAPATAQEVVDVLGDAVDIIVDGGPSPLGVVSTVLDLSREPPAVLRRGVISTEDIVHTLGRGIVEPPPD